MMANSDIAETTTKKGSHMTFLTPGRKGPSLKTTVTKPKSFFLESISPVYKPSVVSPSGTNLSEIFTSPFLSARSETKPDIVFEPAIEKDESQGVQVRKRQGPKKNCESHEKEVDEIEAQIIPGTLIKSKDSENSSNTTDVLSEYDSQSLDYTRGNRNKEIEGKGRRYTSSFCSNSSGDESLIAQSRSSLCDGCSSSTSNSLFSQPTVADLDGPNGDSSGNVFHPQELSDVRFEALLDAHLSLDGFDTSQNMNKSHLENDNLLSKDNPQKLSLSTEQMLFLLLRMVLSKYRQLIEDQTAEKKSGRSQRQTIACLIQAIILLSRRVKSTSEQWRKTQLQLNLIQREHEKLRRHQRKIYIVMCLIVVFNLCSLQAVRNRVSRIVKFFGIVENVRKINRFRKMVAENWRSIPSLLTDFWRIFIFRSSTRLKN